METTTNEMVTAAQNRLALAASRLSSAARTYEKVSAGFSAGHLSVALVESAERCACRAEDELNAAREYMDGILGAIRAIQADAQLYAF